MIKIPLKKACELLDDSWHVSIPDKTLACSHNSYGCTGDPDEDFLFLDAGTNQWQFFERDNAEVGIAGDRMTLVAEAGAKVALVLFMKLSWLEGAWVDAVKD